MPREALLGGAPLRDAEFMSGIDVQSGERAAHIEKVSRQKDQRGGRMLAILHVKVGGEERKIKINAAIEAFLCNAFGKDASGWRGRDVVLYFDGSIQFGGKRVGGLRIKTGQARAQKDTADPVDSERRTADLMQGIDMASTIEELTAMSEAIKGARDGLTQADTVRLRDAYRARQDALQNEMPQE